MTITYRILANAAYYKTLMDRYDLQRVRWQKFSFQYTALGLFIAAVYFLMTPPMTEKSFVYSLAIGAFVAYGSLLITKLGLFWRLSRRPDFGQEHEVVVSEEGITAIGAHVKGNWSWPAYPDSVRFPDGILLMRRGAIRWLPDAAIANGDARTATALVASKTTLRHLDH